MSDKMTSAQTLLVCVEHTPDINRTQHTQRSSSLPQQKWSSHKPQAVP
jgi:hypothetical protein